MILKNKRIFIIEDNLENRAIMQLLLEQQGAQTAIERWGLEATKRLKEFAPVDIILLDLMFPDNVTGYDIFDAIRELPEFKDVPIVAVSAADPVTAISKTHEKGFAGFICKPVKFGHFAYTIASILKGEEVWQTK